MEQTEQFINREIHIIVNPTNDPVKAKNDPVNDPVKIKKLQRLKQNTPLPLILYTNKSV